MPWALRVRRLARLLLACLVAGVLSGVAGAALTLVLEAVQRATLGYRDGTFETAIQHTPPARIVIAFTLGGLLSGLGWWALRRRRRVPSLRSVVVEPVDNDRLTVVSLDALLQVLFVGAGGSVGREGAPRQLAAGLTSRVLGTTRLDGADLQVLVAAGAGAGLAAVYTTPVAGAIFALEIVLARWSTRALALALLVSGLATLVARPVTHDATTYRWPGGELTLTDIGWSVAVIPLAAGLGLLFVQLIRGARPHRQRHVGVWVTLAALTVGLTATVLPAIPGKGKAVIQDVLVGHPDVLTLAALTLAKPVVTGLCLRAGATGGVLTPALATGAAAGGAVALIASGFGIHAELATWALVAAAAVLAVSQDAPFFAVAFAWELTRPSLWLLIPIAVAAFGAWVATRWAGVLPTDRPPTRS